MLLVMSVNNVMEIGQQDMGEQDYYTTDPECTNVNLQNKSLWSFKRHESKMFDLIIENTWLQLKSSQNKSLQLYIFW